jgi:molybdenum cofactor cytidylyltransferase
VSAAVLVLAAGAGLRLGGAAKALMPARSGATYLETIVGCARRAGIEDITVVVGEPFAEAVAAAAHCLAIAVVHNPRPADGMASSVHAGLGPVTAKSRAQTVLLWPVDHFMVTVVTVRLVLRASGPWSLVVPTYRGRGGHPTAFGADFWPELARCTSAREVVRAHPAQVIRLPVNDIGVVRDVDVVADLP